MKIKEAIKDKITGEWGEENGVGLGVQILRTTNFTNAGRISYEKVVKRNIPDSLIEKKKLLPGDIIIEKSGGSPKQPVGRVVFFDNNNDLFLCNNFTAILRPSEQLVPKYFFYDLFYKHLSQVTLKYQNKTTGIINLQLDRYLDEKINVPSLDKQNRIVQILDTADTLRQKRKEQLNLLDDYLKSVYFEMFGDPVENNKKWNTTKMNDVTVDIISGWSASGELRQKKKDEYGVLKISSVTYGIFKPDEHKSIKKDLIKKKIVHPLKGDVLFSRANTRELVGASCLVDDNYYDLFLPDKLWKIEIKNDVVNAVYFQKTISSSQFRCELAKKATGTSGSMLNISKEKFISESLILPPKKLQNKFASIVEQVEQTKQKMRASFDEMNNHFNALMQKYFG